MSRRTPRPTVATALLVVVAAAATTPAASAPTPAERDFRLGRPFTFTAYGDGKNVCLIGVRFRGRIDERESYSFDVTFRLKPAGEQWANDGIGGMNGSLVANHRDGRFTIVPRLDLYGRGVGERRVSYQRMTWRYLATRRSVRVHASAWVRADDRDVWAGERSFRASTREMRRCTLGR